MKKETEFTPFAAALNNLYYISDMFIQTPAYEDLKVIFFRATL